MLEGIILGMLIWQTLTIIVFYAITIFGSDENQDLGLYFGCGIWTLILGFVVVPLSRVICKTIKKFKKRG